MSNSRKSNVRMGTGPKLPPTKTLIIGGIAVAVLIVIIVVISALLSSDDIEQGPTGCRRDADCGKDRFCAHEGCIILISSEYAGLWRDDLAAQADAGVDWQPRASFGEKLIPSDKCPGKTGKVDEPPLGKIETVKEVTIHELRSTELVTHRYKRFKGAVWIGSLRFEFPGLKSISAKEVCTSDPVSEIVVGKQSKGKQTEWYVDGTLKQTVPVGAIASAAVAVKQTLPPPDADGTRTVSFELKAVFGDDMRRHTVAAFPLGSNINSLTGPPPTQQRLLKGYIAYYWEHKNKPSRVSINYEVPVKDHPNLDVSSVNP